MFDLDADHAARTEMTAAAAEIARRAQMAADLGYPTVHTTAVAVMCDAFRALYGVPVTLVTGQVTPPAPEPAPAAKRGRPPTPPVIVAAVLALRERGTGWKEIAAAINSDHGTDYTAQNVRDIARRDNRD